LNYSKDKYEALMAKQHARSRTHIPHLCPIATPFHSLLNPTVSPTPPERTLGLFSTAGAAASVAAAGHWVLGRLQATATATATTQQFGESPNLMPGQVWGIQVTRQAGSVHCQRLRRSLGR